MILFCQSLDLIVKETWIFMVVIVHNYLFLSILLATFAVFLELIGIVYSLLPPSGRPTFFFFFFNYRKVLKLLVWPTEHVLLLATHGACTITPSPVKLNKHKMCDCYILVWNLFSLCGFYKICTS